MAKNGGTTLLRFRKKVFVTSETHKNSLVAFVHAFDGIYSSASTKRRPSDLTDISQTFEDGARPSVIVRD